MGVVFGLAVEDGGTTLMPVSPPSISKGRKHAGVEGQESVSRVFLPALLIDSNGKAGGAEAWRGSEAAGLLSNQHFASAHA
jgi:hypothetical protein